MEKNNKWRITLLGNEYLTVIENDLIIRISEATTTEGIRKYVGNMIKFVGTLESEYEHAKTTKSEYWINANCIIKMERI